jgi:ABC-type uncharacterized transport system involved in gliding motility auxiliary subunit
MKKGLPIRKFIQQHWLKVFWLSPLLLVAGLSAGVIAGWNSLPLALVVSGVVLIALWFLFYSSFTPGFWQRRSTQTSTNAFVATLSVLAILALVNFLGVRYVQRVDLSENQLFTLAPQTQQVLRNLKQPTKILLFIKPDDPAASASRTLLERYRQVGNQFSFDLIDPDAQPNVAESYGVKNYGDAFLEVGERKQFIQNVSQTERLSESRLTNGLSQISNNQKSQVYFLQGHGERSLEPGERGSLSQAVAALNDKNFVTEPLNLIEKQTVPEDAAAVIVAGPQQALFEGEVKALRNYLDRGGSVFLLIDPNTDPKLNALLSEWDVTLENKVVINASNQQVANLGPAAAVVNQYGEHPITQDFGNRFSFFPLTRPVQAKPEGDLKVTPLLITGQEFWAETNIKEQNLQLNPEQGDVQGQQTLGFALSRPVKTDTKPSPKPSPSPSPTNSPAADSEANQKEARLVVIGNSVFATDGFFGQQLNGDLFLNSVSWLSKRDNQTLSIRPKEAKNRRINMTPQQASLVSWTALGVLPVLGFGSAIYVWLRKR